MTSASTITLITALIGLKKQNKVVENNTNSTETLNKSVLELEDVKNEIKTNTESNTLLVNEVERLKTENEALKEKLELVDNKLVAVLDIMSVVYSMHRDGVVRKTVSNIVSTAKFNDIATKDELTKQIQELESEVQAETEKLKESVTKKAERVKNAINNENKNEVLRY